MSTVFTGTVYNTLKRTLDKVIDDKTNGYEAKSEYKKWIREQKMDDHWEDDLESGGPGLASFKAEGTEIAVGTLREGYTTRYIARPFAQRLIITEEAIEDSKYKEILNAAGRLNRSMWKTVDIDMTNIWVRAWNTAYVGGDSQPLFSASHTLPHGGTFSNTMSVPLGPSRAAVITARTAAGRLPGHDGIIEGVDLKKVVCPLDQWGTWEGIIGSSHAPEPGQYNEINVVYKMGLELCPLKYWTNTTTNYAFLTDCDYPINLRWRRKPKSGTWVEESQELMNYKISARWARGWSDPRCAYGVQA